MIRFWLTIDGFIIATERSSCITWRFYNSQGDDRLGWGTSKQFKAWIRKNKLKELQGN